MQSLSFALQVVHFQCSSEAKETNIFERFETCVILHINVGKTMFHGTTLGAAMKKVRTTMLPDSAIRNHYLDLSAFQSGLQERPSHERREQPKHLKLCGSEAKVFHEPDQQRG